MWSKQPEAKETGHTPEIMGPGGTKDDPVTKNAESKKPQLCKSQSQDNLGRPHQVLSETHFYTQEAYSKSTAETINSKSTVERKEQTHTSFSHTHKFSVSSSPIERDRRICTLQQSKRPSQDTPPPSQGECHAASSGSEKQTAGLRNHPEKSHGVCDSHTAGHALHTEAKVCVNDFFSFYLIHYTVYFQKYVATITSHTYVLVDYLKRIVPCKII